MAWYSGITSAAKKVASTVKKVVTAPAKAVSSVANKIATKASPTVNKAADAVYRAANTSVPKSVAQPASTSIAKSLFTSPTSSFKTSSTPSFGMGSGQLSGTGLIKNGPGGAGGGSSSSKTSIPSPTTLNTGSKSFTLVSQPVSYSAGNAQLSASGTGFSSSNSGTGILQHTGGQSALPGSVSTTSHGGFGMGENQVSGTKLLQGDPQKENQSLWDKTKGFVGGLFNRFQDNGLAYQSGLDAKYGGANPPTVQQYLASQPQSRLGGITQAVGNAAGTFLGGAGKLVGAELAGLGSAALQIPRLFTSPGSEADNFWAAQSAGGLQMANNLVKNAIAPYKSVFNAGNPEQVMPAQDVQGAQSKDTNVKPGQTIDDLQGGLSRDTITTLDSIYKINNVGGEKYLDLSSIFDTQNQQTYTMTSPDGQTVTVTQAQYDANPQYWEDLAAQGGFQVTPNDTMAVDMPPEIQDPVVRDSLQAQYNQLQKDAGITEAINQSKEIESQMAAIEAALIKQRDAVMEDPDFSLATKEGRINYIFKNSMEARTYEALTKRAEVLANFIDKQNEMIITQLGFRQQDIQNQLAYQQANQPAQRQTQVVTINGQQVLIDSQTGQPISTLGAQGDGSVDLSKDQRYQNYQTRETQWNNVVGTISRFAPQGFNPASSNAWASVDWKAMANNKPAVDAIANAVTRMANPDITRAAAGGDPYATESLFGQAQQLVGQWFQDQNALPQKLQEAVGQAITYWNNSKTEMQQASAQPNRTSVSATDNTAFINAAKQAGYSDSQIQQYLAQQGGSTSAFNW